MSYLIDSNVVINYSAESFDATTLSNLDVIFDTYFNYSVIALMEVMGYNYGPEEVKKLKKLFDAGNRLDINEAVITDTINIRKAIKIRLPDAIIAATAIVNNLKLVTDNTNDFIKISGLKVISPKNIKIIK